MDYLLTAAIADYRQRLRGSFVRKEVSMDGASEVHTSVLAPLMLEEGAGFWSWDAAR